VLENDLAKAFVEKIRSLGPNDEYTWDDFFDEHCIKEESRSDFTVACILRQARDKYGFGKEGK
jgi:hypothetical protein